MTSTEPSRALPLVVLAGLAGFLALGALGALAYPGGTYCDEWSGVCVGSWSCYSDADCGVGYSCDDRGTCVPTPCTSDDQCAAACYCDEATGQCVESGYCAADADCPAGQTCDESRSTCIPSDPVDPPTGCTVDTDCTGEQVCCDGGCCDGGDWPAGGCCCCPKDSAEASAMMPRIRVIVGIRN